MAVDNVAQSLRGEYVEFAPHQIRFHQGVSKAVAEVRAKVDVRVKLIDVACQMTSWIKRTSARINDFEQSQAYSL